MSRFITEDPDRTVMPSDFTRHHEPSDQSRTQSQIPMEGRGRTERRPSPQSQLSMSREPSLTASVYPQDTEDEAEGVHQKASDKRAIKPTDHISIAWLVQKLEDPLDPLNTGSAGPLGFHPDLLRIRTPSQLLNNLTQHKEKYFKVFQHMNHLARKLQPTKNQRDEIHRRFREALETHKELKERYHNLKGKDAVTFEDEYTQSEEARVAAVEENRTLTQQVNEQNNKIIELQNTLKTIMEFGTRSSAVTPATSRPQDRHRSRSSRHRSRSGYHRDDNNMTRGRKQNRPEPSDPSSSSPSRSRSRRSRRSRRSHRSRRSRSRHSHQPTPPPRDHNTPADTVATTTTAQRRVPKIPDPPVFDGKDRDMYPDWKDGLRFKLWNDPRYDTPQLRIGYLLTRTWDIPRVRIRDRCNPQSSNPFTDFEDALKDLDKLYEDYDTNRTAKAEFKKLKMGDRETFDDFYVKFQALVVRTNLRDNEETQMDELKEKINKGLKSSLRMQLDAQSLNELLRQCRNLDHNRRIFNEEFPISDRSNRKGNPRTNTAPATTNTYTPRSSTNIRSSANPIAGQPYTVYPQGTTGVTIAPLTNDAERQWLTQNGYCLRCRQQGHKFFDFDKCPMSKENRSKSLKNKAMTTTSDQNETSSQNQPASKENQRDAPIQSRSAQLGTVITNLDDEDDDSTGSEN